MTLWQGEKIWVKPAYSKITIVFVLTMKIPKTPFSSLPGRQETKNEDWVWLLMEQFTTGSGFPVITNINISQKHNN